MRKISGDNTPDKNILRQPMNQESPQTPDTFGKNTSENSVDFSLKENRVQSESLQRPSATILRRH